MLIGDKGIITADPENDRMVRNERKTSVDGETSSRVMARRCEEKETEATGKALNERHDRTGNLERENGEEASYCVSTAAVKNDERCGIEMQDVDEERRGEGRRKVSPRRRREEGGLHKATGTGDTLEAGSTLT